MASDHKDLKWFFTNDDDERGVTWASILISNNFQPDREGTNVFQNILYAKDYASKGVPGVADYDLNYEVVDFIIKTALYHREIDRPSGAGNYLTYINDNLKHFVEDITNLDEIVDAAVTQDAIVKKILNKAPSAGGKTWDQIIAAFEPKQPNIRAQLKAAFGNAIIQFRKDINARNPAYDFTIQADRDDLQNKYYGILNKAAKDTIISNSEFGYKAVDQNILDNVFAKWNSLDRKVQEFYATYLQVLKRDATSGTWSSPVTDFSEVVRNPSNYRLNLMKEPIGSDTTKFQKSIPLVKENVGIWFTDKKGNVVKHDRNTHPEFLQDLYHGIYAEGRLHGGKRHWQSGGADIYGEYPSTYEQAKQISRTKNFSMNADKTIRDRLYALARIQFSPGAASVPFDGPVTADFMSMIDAKKWRKTADGYVAKVNGQDVKYPIGDPNNELFEYSSKCFSTGISGATKPECETYIHECLLQENPKELQKCIEIFKTKPNFFESAKNDINKMHPLVARRTLQRFGFHTITVKDSAAGMPLKKVENVNSWLKNFVDTRFDGVDRKQIEQNTTLLNYLELLSQYVNANPGILNQGYGGTSEEQQGAYTPPDWVSKLGIPKYVTHTEAGRQNVGLRLKSYFQTSLLGAATQRQQNPFFRFGQSGQIASPFGANLTGTTNVMIPQAIVGMSGGGLLSDYVSGGLPAITNGMSGATFTERVFKQALAELKSLNKRLDPQEEKNLMDRIQKLKKEEDELIRTVLLITEYNKLSIALKNYDSQTLNKADLERLVARHTDMQGHYALSQERLMDILTKLQELISGEVSDSSRQPITTN